MFIVRQSFRTTDGLKPAGSIIEPADIKGFRARIRDNKIVEVTESNYERWSAFFLARYDIKIPSLTPVSTEEKLPSSTLATELNVTLKAKLKA